MISELPGKHPGDDEAGDHEKDINPDESSAYRQARVVGHDEKNSDGPKALDVESPPTGDVGGHADRPTPDSLDAAGWTLGLFRDAILGSPYFDAKMAMVERWVSLGCRLTSDVEERP
jgi:hypothetical protein